MAEKASSSARLEAFSDGVIAVIITIMVLELKVPHANGVAGLKAILPILLVYLVSFSFVAIYWVNHQHLLERAEEAEPRILYANFLFLFFSSLLPFFTSYVIEKEVSSFAVALYAVSTFATGFSFLLLRLAVQSQLGAKGKLVEEDRSELWKHLASLALYLAAIPLAYVHAGLGLALIAVMTLIWALPLLATKHQHRHSRH